MSRHSASPYVPASRRRPHHCRTRVKDRTARGAAIGVYGLIMALQSTTLSLLLADAVHAGPLLIGLFFAVRLRDLRPESGDHALGRSRGGHTTKFHRAVEQGEKPLVVIVAPGYRGDSLRLIPVPDKIRVSRLHGARPALVIVGRAREQVPCRPSLTGFIRVYPPGQPALPATVGRKRLYVARAAHNPRPGVEMRIPTGRYRLLARTASGCPQGRAFRARYPQGSGCHGRLAGSVVMLGV